VLPTSLRFEYKCPVCVLYPTVSLRKPGASDNGCSDEEIPMVT